MSVSCIDKAQQKNLVSLPLCEKKSNKVEPDYAKTFSTEIQSINPSTSIFFFQR